MARAPWIVRVIPARPKVPVNLAPASPQPADQSATSIAVYTAAASTMTVQATVAGSSTIVGTLMFYVSDSDPLLLGQNPGLYTPPDSAFVQLAQLPLDTTSGTSTVMSNAIVGRWQYVRVGWVPSAGSGGTLTVDINLADGT